tara:strand:+ start:4268 stop:4720 length:453 start_codon:yes stop_codon:yes gene_type:complete
MGESIMGWFSKKEKKELKSNSPQDMSPLEAVTHLCAAIHLADQQTDYEERQVWINTINDLFPEFSEERADRFLNEAYTVINQKPESEKSNYIIAVLKRIKELLSQEQINSLVPKIKDLVEADGIVMMAELEVTKLVEEHLNVTITIDEDL